MSRVLITGAAGFLAAQLVAALRAHGVVAIAGTDMRPRVAGFDDWHEANLSDASSALKVVFRAEPDVVYHLAGAFHGAADALFAANVATTVELLSAVQAAAHGARVVVIGSAAEYGRVPATAQPVKESYVGQPVSDYGRAKSAVRELAARYAAEFGVHVVVARPFNVVGRGISGDLVVGAIVHRLRAALASPAPRSIAIGTTDSVRDFVAADDVADGLILAASRGVPGAAYNLCTGIGHSVQTVLDQLIALSGAAITVVRDEALVRTGEVDTLIGDSSAARTALGWQPTRTLEDALRAAWDGSALAGALA
jgi:GDP-4-dehydro-6-deoxy-D-mannose reductase